MCAVAARRRRSSCALMGLRAVLALVDETCLCLLVNFWPCVTDQGRVHMARPRVSEKERKKIDMRRAQRRQRHASGRISISENRVFRSIGSW